MLIFSLTLVIYSVSSAGIFAVGKISANFAITLELHPFLSSSTGVSGMGMPTNSVPMSWAVAEMVYFAIPNFGITHFVSGCVGSGR